MDDEDIRFVGTHIKNIDKKMRVSVPKVFREYLVAGEADTSGKSDEGGDGMNSSKTGGDRVARTGASGGKPMVAGVHAVLMRGMPVAVCGGFELRRIIRSQLYQEFPKPSRDRARKERALLGRIKFMPFDGDGRIVLDAELAEHVRFDDRVSFVGLGDRFELWEPDALRKEQDAEEENAYEDGLPF